MIEYRIIDVLIYFSKKQTDIFFQFSLFSFFNAKIVCHHEHLNHLEESKIFSESQVQKYLFDSKKSFSNINLGNCSNPMVNYQQQQTNLFYRIFQINSFTSYLQKNPTMRRQSERIPTIRKQYVQTIYDGLTSQFDEILNNQLQDQIEKVQTLKSVYQSSLQAQNSIIAFLSKVFEEKLESCKESIQEFKLYLAQLEISEDKQRKSVIITTLSEKMEQTGVIISVLNSSLEELKAENQNMATKLTEIIAEKEISEKKNREKIDENTRKIQELQQLMSEKISLTEQMNKKNEDNEKLMKENKQLLQLKKESQCSLNFMEEQLQMVLKFTHCEQKQTRKLKQKICQKQMINKQQQQIQKLREFSQQEESKLQIMAKQAQNKKLNKYNDGLKHKDLPGLLSKISEKEEQSRVSQHSINNEGSQGKQISMKGSNSFTQTNINNQSDLYPPQAFASQQNVKNQMATHQEEKAFLVIRQCESLNTQSIDDEDDYNLIDHEIEQIKLALQRRHSSNQSFFDQSDELDVATEEDDSQNISKFKQQFAQRVARQSKRTSNIIGKLNQNRIALNQYQNQLQQQISILNKRIQAEKTKYYQCVNEQNQKINDLMSKIYELQEQRIRGITAIQNYEVELIQKGHAIELLCTQVEKLREQNHQHVQNYDKKVEQLQVSMNKELKETKSNKEKVQVQKNQFQSQIKYLNQVKHELISVIETKNSQLEQNQIKIIQFTQNIDILTKKLQSSQEVKETLENNLLEYRKYIDELEAKIKARDEQQKKYVEEIEKPSKVIDDLQEKLQKVMKEVNAKQQQIEKLILQKKMLDKNNEDLKYMNAVLKKDVMKIKEVESINFDKQPLDNPNLKLSKFSKMTSIVTNLPSKEDPNQYRMKNYSFTAGSPNESSATNLKLSFLSNKHSISGKQNPTGSKVNLRDPNLNLSMKLDTDYTSKKQQNYFAKDTILEKYEDQNMTERPLTEIIKKKYKIG